MVKTRKSAKPEESMLRRTKEVTALKRYRYSADRPKRRKPPENYNRYVEELDHLQFELIKLQEWVRLQGHGLWSSSLSTPTERERGQWYFQRYVAQLPAQGEIARVGKRPFAQNALNGAMPLSFARQ